MANATPRPLYPWERDPVLIVYEGGWAPESVLTGAENRVSTGIQFSDRPARGEWLYRLSYRGYTLCKDRVRVINLTEYEMVRLVTSRMAWC